MPFANPTYDPSVIQKMANRMYWKARVTAIAWTAAGLILIGPALIIVWMISQDWRRCNRLRPDAYTSAFPVCRDCGWLSGWTKQIAVN